MSYQTKSPVLFLIFNRPEESKLVFNAIKKVKPSKLYISADGPRASKTDEATLCEQTRQVIDIDWQCEVKTLYRTQNLGCKDAVSNAITWFFDNEPEGIILEDDCLPSEDFFVFADQMLEYYRFNTDIAHICGCNFQDNIARNQYSYYYSNISHVWGWASWRRVWKNYDVNLNWLENALKKDFLKQITDSKINKLFLELSLKRVKNQQINTWDYQYGFLNNYNNMLSVIPNNNMISNIGFNENATHTAVNSKLANLPFVKLQLPLKHPLQITASRQADEYTLKKEVPGALSVIWSTVKHFIKKTIGYNNTTY